MMPHIGYRSALAVRDLALSGSLAGAHRPRALVPPILANSGSRPVAAVGADALGLVIRVPATAPTADVGGLLPLAHARSSL